MTTEPPRVLIGQWPPIAKIKCGEAHFEALAVGDRPAKFIKARNVADMFAQG
jgi:hypothetical protein